MTWTAQANMLIALAYAPAPCFHKNTEPVHLRLTGELVAQICLDCDVQLSPGFMGRYAHQEAS